jgi:DNA-binding CsgD family transcriptional regulator
MFSEENGLVGREQGEWGGCLDWIGSVPIPALLVSVDLRIRAYNTLAARLLVRRDLIRANAGYLSCSADSATVQLHKAVARVGGRQCVAEAFPINPESPASAGIIVVRDAKTYYGTPVVLVLAAERKTLHGPGPDPKLLRQAFGFTPTEARLASHLAQGRTLADCACLLTVTEQSARTYLRSLFRKTQTGRQTELVLLLVHASCYLPPPLRQTGAGAHSHAWAPASSDD